MGSGEGEIVMEEHSEGSTSIDHNTDKKDLKSEWVVKFMNQQAYSEHGQKCAEMEVAVCRDGGGSMRRRRQR
jgi:hypothetical protein